MGLLGPDLADIDCPAGMVRTLGLRRIKIRLLALELESLPVKRSVNEFVCDGGAAAAAVERGGVAGEGQRLVNLDLYQTFRFKVGTSHDIRWKG